VVGLAALPFVPPSGALTLSMAPGLEAHEPISTANTADTKIAVKTVFFILILLYNVLKTFIQKFVAVS
jgi:hypothetical protein